MFIIINMQMVNSPLSYGMENRFMLSGRTFIFKLFEWVLSLTTEDSLIDLIIILKKHWNLC